MAPRRSATSAPAKRERSASSSLSPAPDNKPVKATKAEVVVSSEVNIVKVKKTKVSKAAKEDADDVKPKKVAKNKAWPPADLNPAEFPPRSGYPIFGLPPLTSPAHGGVVPSIDVPRPLFVGAHTSIAGGPATALFRARKAGANGVAMFLKSQRQWKSNPYEQEAIDRFHAASKSKEDGGLGYPPETILVHGSYLINLGNPDKTKWETSYQCFKDDIYRCHQLGIKLYNWQ